jgi:hypothetical protein
LKVNSDLQISPPRLPPAPSSLCFLSAQPCRPRRPCAEPQLPPRRLSLRHVPLQHPAHCFPARAGPLRAPPRHTAAARASTCAAELDSTCFRPPCLFLDLKHVLELPTNSLLPSCTCISTVFLFPELHTSPELRRSSCSSSTTASAASHPRSSAPTAPLPPIDARKPAQFHSPAPERPDHYAGELELPPPLGLTVVPTLRRLLAPAENTISTTSSRGSFLATSPPTLRSPERRRRPSEHHRPTLFAVEPPPQSLSSPTPATPVTAMSF